MSTADKLRALHKQMRNQMPDVIADLRAKADGHDAPPREAGYTIHNADDTAVVRIYDEIWWLGVNAQDLARDLDGITTPNIRVEINSPGGDVWDGIAIYNALRTHPAKVTTRVDGIAASIASVIAQAGDHRIMLGGSQLMVHNAWGMTIGDNRDHADMSDVLAHQDGIIAGIYASRSGRSEDEFRALMNSETWMTAAAAVEAGLADEVVEPAAPQDKVSLSDRITSAARCADEVLSDVERLVADHDGTGDALTGAKRDGLVALAAASVRVSDLLEPAVSDTPAPMADELVEKRLAARKRDVEFRASLPPAFLA